MQLLPDYPITDFTGGLVANKGNYQMKDNELVTAMNVSMDPGRMQKRLGSKLFGSFADAPDADEVMTYGATILNQDYLANKNIDTDNGMVYYMATGFLDGNVAVNATTIAVKVGANFDSAGGNVEINGYNIAYTGVTVNNLTGVTGVTVALATGTPVRQWRDLYAAARNTISGTWFAFLNNLTVISHGHDGGYVTVDSALTVTNRLSTDAPTCICTYKQRVYGLDPTVLNQVDYTGLTDPTSFPAANKFTVEDDRGENLCNLKPYAGKLSIWKPNSTFVYNLSQLSQANSQVGTYNDRTLQEINGLLYTFCPRGVFKTNLSSFTDIGRPVQKFLNAFRGKYMAPTTGFNAPLVPVTPNSVRDGDKWVLFLGTITVDQTTYENIALVYDTVYEYWSMRNGFDTPTGFFSSEDYRDSYSLYGTGAMQKLETNFFFMNQQNVYQAHDDKSFSGTSSTVISTGVESGNILTQDRISGSSGIGISSDVWTKFYDQRTPGWWKKFRYLRILSEVWPVNIDVRTITTTGFSNWKAIGQVKGPNVVLKTDIEGYAIQVRIGDDSPNDPWVMNGLVLESTELISQNHE